MQGLDSCITDVQKKSNLPEVMVSVYCLTYNHKKYIRDALDGFVSQKTTFQFEVIVHDDASTDGTQEVIREYAEKYPNIIKPIFQKENQYSKGVEFIKTLIWPQMKGRYVAICEGDDYWTDPEKLQLQFDVMEKYPECTICTHITRWINMSSGTTGGYIPARKFSMHEGVVDKAAQMRASVYGAFHLSSMFLRKSVYDEYYGDSPDFVEKMPVGDLSLQLYFSRFGYMYFIEREMAVYRRGTEESWTVRVERTPQKALDHYEQLEKSLISCKKFYSGEYQDLFNERICKADVQVIQLKGDKHVLRKKFGDILRFCGLKTVIKVYFVEKSRFLNKIWNTAQTMWERCAR